MVVWDDKRPRREGKFLSDFSVLKDGRGRESWGGGGGGGAREALELVTYDICDLGSLIDFVFWWLGMLEESARLLCSTSVYIKRAQGGHWIFFAFSSHPSFFPFRFSPFRSPFLVQNTIQHHPTPFYNHHHHRNVHPPLPPDRLRRLRPDGPHLARDPATAVASLRRHGRRAGRRRQLLERRRTVRAARPQLAAPAARLLHAAPGARRPR